MSELRYTIYAVAPTVRDVSAVEGIPYSHRPTLEQAVSYAKALTDNRTAQSVRIVERDRAYPFTHRRTFTPEGDLR